MEEIRSPVEQIRSAFEVWEKRGRGWPIFPFSVELEPAFMPFLMTLVPQRVVDDGRRHTWLSALVERILSGSPKEEEAPELPDLKPDAYPFTWPEEVVEIRLAIPHRADVPKGGAAALLRNIGAMRLPLSFELEGRNGKVSIRFACARSDAAILENTIGAVYPGIVPVRETTSLGSRLDQGGEVFKAVEFGLSREFLIPLHIPGAGIDLLSPAISALAAVGDGEAGLVQILFSGVLNPWNKALSHLLEADAKEEVLLPRHVARGAAEKAASPLFAAVLRVGAISGTDDNAWSLIRRIASSLGQFDHPHGNGFTPLGTDDEEALYEGIVDRTTDRTGMLLSVDELGALVHIPSDTAKLARERVGLKRPPADALGSEGVSISTAHFRGEALPIRLSDAVRSRHVHVIGATGTGKSTLLLSMMLDDAAAGRGFALFDPHGDLADGFLARLPESRYKDVILFDPSDASHVLGWNMLAAATDSERDILADDFVGIFRRLSTSWGDQMNAVLSNAVLAFLYSKRGGTLEDLRKFLVDASFRADFLRTVDDDRTVGFWKEEFPLLIGKRPQAPILTRLDTFLRSRVIRRIVSETKAQIDFTALVDDGRIFVAQLAQGAIGAENAALLGSLLVSKFHQATLSRHGRAHGNRRPFHLYLDEFQLLATPSMEALFTGARKFGLSLTVAHQNISQLVTRAPETADAVLSEAFTRIAFRVGFDDARTLAKSFASFSPEDLTNLEVGQALAKVGRSEDDFFLETRPLPQRDDETRRQRLAALRTESFARWARRIDDEQETREPKEEAPVDSPPTSAHGGAPEPSRIPLHPPATKEAEPKRPAAPPKERTPGRGGSEHKYLQELIRNHAQAKGFLVTVEEVLPGGGRVDVAMRRGPRSIAVEIAMTPNLEHEIENAKKCLAAGFSLVAVVSLDGRFLARIQKRLQSAASDEERARIRVLKPEELLELLTAEQPPATTVRGYAVKVTTPGTDHEDIRRKQRAIGELIARNARRLKE
jgi:hypothetical protein